MSRLLKLIVVAIVWLSAISVDAHQSGISTFTIIEQHPGKWILKLNSSISAFEYEIENTCGKDAYSSRAEFNQLLIDHLRRNIVIEVNGEEVMLEKGYVKLGHSTSVAFELSEVPETVDWVFVKNEAFKNIKGNKCIFKITKEGFDNGQFMLNNENDYQIKALLEGNQIILAETPSFNYWSIVALPIIVLVLLGLKWFFRKSNSMVDMKDHNY